MNQDPIWRIYLVFIGVILVVLKAKAASIHRDITLAEDHKRIRRGILSKMGNCPMMESNTQRKDTRLNFFGRALVFPGEEVADCFQSECKADGDCEGDQKCCSNNCGALVCSPVVRDPHPCELINCPEDLICKIERVHCQMPYCPDLYARSRPSCVQKPDYYARLARRRSKIPVAEKPREPGPNEVHFSPPHQFKEQPEAFSS